MGSQNHLEKAFANLTFGGFALLYSYMLNEWRSDAGSSDDIGRIIMYYISLSVGYAMIVFGMLRLGRFIRERIK